MTIEDRFVTSATAPKPTGERIPVSGVFVLDDGAVPSWWEGTITASREALISAGEYRDLGPVKLRLDEAGHVMRLSDGGLVPLTLVRPQAGQSFHYVMKARGQGMLVQGSFEIPEGAVDLDLPTALRASIPDDELPEWLRIRSAVETARDEAVQAAGEASAASAGLDASIRDAVDIKVPAAVDGKLAEIDLPALVGDEISTLAGPAVQVEVDARVDPLVTQAEEAADSAVAARDGMVTGGTVSGDDLILSTVDGGSFVAGNVRGAPGAPGAPGAIADASSYILTGPGRPDVPATTGGIITGVEPVGAEFRSTDGAGVGAWVWMKRPTGWIVTDGDTGWRDITELCTSDWLDLSVKFRYKGGRCTLDVQATAPVSPPLRIVDEISGLAAFAWAQDNLRRGTWITVSRTNTGVARTLGTAILMYGTIPEKQRLSAVIEWETSDPMPYPITLPGTPV